MSNEGLKLKLKEQIIEYLNLMDLEPKDIADDADLFGPDGLGLDSIDSIELIVLMEREYELKITDPKEGRKVFGNINSIVAYLEEKGKV